MRVRLFVGLMMIVTVLGIKLSWQAQRLEAQGICNPRISHFEFTQAIQKGNPYNGDHSLEDYPIWIGAPPEVPLVDNRATTIRTYVDCDNCICEAGELGGSLQLSEANGGGVIFSGLNYRFADNLDEAMAHDAPWDRTNENETLNFTFLPGEGTSTARQVIAHVCVGRLIGVPGGPNSAGWFGVENTDCEQQTVTFNRREPVEIWGHPIKYNDTIPNSGSYEEDYAENMLFDAQPVPDRSDYDVRQMQEGLQAVPRGAEVYIKDLGNGAEFVPNSSIGIVHLGVGGAFTLINQTTQQVIVRRYAAGGCTGAFSSVTLAPAGDPQGLDIWSTSYNQESNSCTRISLDASPNPPQEKEYTFDVIDDPERLRLNGIDNSDYQLKTGADRQRYVGDLKFYRDNIWPNPDIIYAWFLSSEIGRVSGASITTAGIGGDDMERLQGSFAHEFVHMVGYVPHSSGDTIDEVGLNVLNRLGGDKIHDLSKKNLYLDHGGINPTTARWINTETYGWVYDAIPPGSTSPGFRQIPIEGEFIAVQGIIPANPAVLATISNTRIIKNRLALAPEMGGGAEIRLVGAGGGAIYTTTLPLSPISDTLYYAVVPYDPQTTAIELYRAGVLQDTITRTLNSPVVSLTYPPPGYNLNGITAALAWTAGDVDGDDLMTSIHYSHDNGISWMPIEFLKDDSYWNLEGYELPASNGTGVLRIIVSDGVNWAIDEVDGLTIGENHYPSIMIVSPGDGLEFVAGENIPLLARYSDLEDGWLNGATGAYVDLPIMWESNLDGVIGTGPSVNAVLSVGVHLITATVTDSAGFAGSDTITLNVVAVP